MDKHKFIFLFGIVTFFIVSCGDESTKDSVNPVTINLYGKPVDTAYLNVEYEYPFAYVTGEGISGDYGVYAKMTGKVNTAELGTYYLDYDYTDVKGHPAATVTRTVHVVVNSASTLNGSYNAVCTCTKEVTGTTNHILTTDTYTAKVSSLNTNNRFELINLKIGSEYVIPITTLKDNSISVDFYRHVGSLASGTLSAEKNTFTIETTVYETSNITYKCKNVYTKNGWVETKKGIN